MKLLRNLLILLVVTPGLCFALALRSNAPSRYVVKDGDSLWGIASRYLVRPWQWKQIWQNNPHIKNPHKIFPGAVLELRRYKGKPYLAMTRRGVVRLSPRVRKEPLENPIPPIPLNHIKPFLNGSRVFTQDQLAGAPYVVSYAGEHLMGGPGNKIYVKDNVPTPTRHRGKKTKYVPTKSISIMNAQPDSKWVIFRSRGKYVNPKTKKLLGYMALRVGEAQMEDPGNPATMLLTRIDHGVEVGDRVLPNELDTYPPNFIPQAPRGKIRGEIIDMFQNATQVGSNQVVIINQGKVNRLRPGDVLAIVQEGKTIEDPVHKKQEVRLPNRRVGELMVFKVFKHVSFGLVVRATDPVQLDDLIRNP